MWSINNGVPVVQMRKQGEIRCSRPCRKWNSLTPILCLHTRHLSVTVHEGTGQIMASRILSPSPRNPITPLSVQAGARRTQCYLNEPLIRLMPSKYSLSLANAWLLEKPVCAIPCAALIPPFTGIWYSPTWACSQNRFSSPVKVVQV